MTSPGKRVTREEVAEMQRLRRMRYSYDAIAVALCRSRETVRTHLQGYGMRRYLSREGLYESTKRVLDAALADVKAAGGTGEEHATARIRSHLRYLRETAPV